MEENNAQNQPEPKGGSAKGLIITLVVLIILAGAYAWSQKGKNEQQGIEDGGKEELLKEGEKASGMPVPGETGVKETEVKKDESMTAEVKVFAIDAKNFTFAPAEIKVKKGDKVKITLNNTQGFHDFVIDEFNVKIAQANGPTSAEVEFTADKTGTFEFYCSVGQHRAMGMKGLLIVE